MITMNQTEQKKKSSNNSSVEKSVSEGSASKNQPSMADCSTNKMTSESSEPLQQDVSVEGNEETKYNKDEYIYNKLVKKRNHVYSCIANVLKNYDRKQVLNAFIPEREKIALKLASILMSKDGLTVRDFSNFSTAPSAEGGKTNEIISLSAINFLINQVYALSAEDEGEMEFSKEAKEHLTTLALDWAKLRDQAFMFSNGMIKLEYELHDELYFTETELYHETEKKLKSIGVGTGFGAQSKLKEMRDQRRKATDRTVNELIDLVKSWHSEIAFLRRITEFYASMRQLAEEEVEALSLLFENFGALLELESLKRKFKEVKLSKIEEMKKNRDKLEYKQELQLSIYEAIMKFTLGQKDVPYFLCRIITKKDGEQYLQIAIISLLLFSRFCNSYSETTRSKKAHDLELIVSEIASLSGWEVVDQNVEILSEGDTVTEIDLIIHRGKTTIIVEVKDLALWRGWYFDRESLIKRYDIFVTAAKKLRERRLLLKNTNAKILIVTALTERWKNVDGVPIVPLKSLHKYLKKLKRLESSRQKAKR